MSQRLVFADIETDIKRDKLVAVCIDGQVYERRKVGDEFLKQLFESIKDDIIVAHYAKFDVKQIYREFGVLFPYIWDTWTAAKVLRNGMKNKDGSPVSNALVDVLYYYLGKKSKIHEDKATLQKGFSIKRDLTSQELEYIKADVVDLPELQRVLADRLEADGLSTVMRMEMALLPVVIKKEVAGVRIDIPKLEGLVKVWKRGKRIATLMLDKEIEILSKTYASQRPTMFVTYGYTSTKQVTQIFKDFGLPVPMKKERMKNGHVVLKESNDEDVLTEYIYEYPTSPLNRFIKIYLWFKEIDKLISTYGEKLLERVVNGHIHTEFNPLGAETSRFSSSNPNLQNISSSGHGAKVRNCFLPDEGDVFVDADMDGAEIRIAADFSGEPLLVDALEKGIDMHSQLASASYSILAGEPITITKSKTPLIVKGHKLIPGRIRDRHKSVTFAYFYLGGPSRIYTIIGDDVRKFRPKDVKQACKEVHAELGRQMPVLSAFLRAKVDEAQGKGFLRGPKFGRVRYFSKDAYGDAANNDIQMTNAEAIKLAMISMDKWLTETGYGRLVLNVHDQLVTSAKPEFAQVVAEKQKQVMADSLSYFLRNLKGSSSVKITKVWEK